MQMAYESTPPPESEERAWLLTQMAHLELVSGDLSKAEACANHALGVFPDYHDALGALAQVRLAQERYQDAVTLLARRYEAAPRAGNLYALAEAQSLAGQREDSLASFAKFERQALAESTLADNSNHELIFYYADHAAEPAKALEVARREVERRHDVFTLDSYAWALAANGDYTAAGAEIQKALDLGIKDPKMLFHAGAIALHLQQIGQAEQYLKDAASRYSRDAAALLRSLSAKAGAGVQ
jgi:tetratricopeptide (TPR) repeat protein